MNPIPDPFLDMILNAPTGRCACRMPQPEARRYRTEIHICVACKLQVSCRIAVASPAFGGTFRMAMSPGLCYRCISIAMLARDGDARCQQHIKTNPAYGADARIQDIMNSCKNDHQNNPL